MPLTLGYYASLNKRRGGVEGAEERPQLAERFAVGDFAPGPAQPFPQPVGFGVVTFAQVAVEFDLLVGQTALDSGLGPPPTQIPFNEYRAASSDLTPPGASNGDRIMAEENLQGNPAGGAVFVFVNNNRDRLRLLHFDGTAVGFRETLEEGPLHLAGGH